MSVSAMNVPFAEIFNSGLWEGQQIFTDGTLQTDDGTSFRIHRVVLAQRSGYFRALFSFNIQEETVLIPNIDSKILEIILLFIYNCKVAVHERDLWDLMIACDYLLVDDFLKCVRSTAIQNMTCANCLPSLSTAWLIDKLAIKEDCYRYALVHFQDIFNSSNGGLQELPFEILKHLLKSNSLNIMSERSVWEVIVSWTEANSSTRLPHVPELLSCLKLEEEIDEDLAVEILSHSIVRKNPHCFDLMLRKQFNNYLTKCTLLSQHATCEAICSQNSPRSYCPRMPNRLHLLARHTLTPTKYGSELFLTYDNELDFWRRIGETEFFIDTIVHIGQSIFMFNAWQNINCIFNIVEETWLPMSIPPAPRYDYNIVTLGGQLYSIGGSTDDTHSTNMIFSYDFDENQWKPIMMTHHFVIFGAVTSKDLIYVVGMAEVEPTPILMFQAYDPVKDTWTLLPPPNVYRRGFSVVAAHEQVFVIAGVNDGQYLKCVEAYDPLKKSWMSLPDLPFQYFYHKSVIVDDKIIVYENNNEEMRYYKASPPVYWDHDAQLWGVMDESSPLYCVDRCTFFTLDDWRLLKDITAKNRRPENKWERILTV
ncbi:Kelch-like protein 17 [Araneus ventricosus]|uniref:Kelch-like protein 17 n=1 Tax=Araneus ventricosus TaxID=182803 RepID=A0A4Y2PI70_ARAVE|nr:Kelch-like protein 17 [Araneus ventricosus]